MMPEEQGSDNHSKGTIPKINPRDTYMYDREVGKVFMQMVTKRHAQLSLKTGLKRFGDDGEAAVRKEIKSFMDFDVLIPIMASELSRQQRADSLPLIMTVKERRSGEVKARGVAGGHKDRGKIPAEDATSPTASTEALYISCAIDAFERRFVGLLDIPSAYFHASANGRISSVVVLEGVLVDLYLQVDPSAAPKVHNTKNGKKRLYARINKALYGHIMVSRLFWEHLSDTLDAMGFTPNPDDLCVLNKEIDGRQCTVVLHVDDIKLSHVNEAVVRKVAAQLSETYGEMELRTGDVLEYCGITLDYGEEGAVKIGAEAHIDEAIEQFGEEMLTPYKTPAVTHLFTIDTECPRLSEDKRQLFHSIFAKLLWVGKKARPDILVALSFLGKRTLVADEDDWKKLYRLLSYLKGTKELRLKLTVDGLSVVKWWADSSFAVHADMKSHSGGFGTLGRGAFYANSTTQKLNTTSSTESEVVAASEMIPQALWTKSFLLHQGYNTNNILFNQDNKAAILLQKNGVLSRGKRSRHVDVRFFFIKDRVKGGR